MAAQFLQVLGVTASPAPCSSAARLSTSTTSSIALGLATNTRIIEQTKSKTNDLEMKMQQLDQQVVQLTSVASAMTNLEDNVRGIEKAVDKLRTKVDDSSTN